MQITKTNPVKQEIAFAMRDLSSAFSELIGEELSDEEISSALEDLEWTQYNVEKISTELRILRSEDK